MSLQLINLKINMLLFIYLYILWIYIFIWHICVCFETYKLVLWHNIISIIFYKLEKRLINCLFLYFLNFWKVRKQEGVCDASLGLNVVLLWFADALKKAPNRAFNIEYDMIMHSFERYFFMFWMPKQCECPLGPYQ